MNVAVRPQVPLAEFMLTGGGSTDPSKQPNDLFVLYSIPSFDAGAPELVKGHAIGSTKKNVQTGDVLLSRIVPHIRRSWIVAQHSEGEILASGEWIVFRSTKIDASYLRYFLMSDEFHSQFMQTVGGVGGSFLRAKPNYVGEITIPLPSLDEQRRVAAILDKADALRPKSREALLLDDQLAHALYADCFGNPVANPAKLPVTTLGELGVEMVYGPRFYNEDYSEEGVRIVRITDLSDTGELDFKAMPRLSVSETDLLAHQSRPGELLFARTGATVGKIAIVSADDPISIPGAYFIRLRFPSHIEPMFAWYTLRCPSVQEIIAERSRQSAQQNFSGPGLRRLPFTVPKLADQRAFVNRVKEIKKLKAHHRAQIASLGSLFTSLQHRAFSGQL